jgi:hypothetical protein
VFILILFFLLGVHQHLNCLLDLVDQRKSIHV